MFWYKTSLHTHPYPQVKKDPAAVMGYSFRPVINISLIRNLIELHAGGYCLHFLLGEEFLIAQSWA